MSQKFSNISEVPLALGVFLASDNYDYEDGPFTISVTTLLKPLRQIILPTRIPPTDFLPPLADMMTVRLGNAIHTGIELAWRDNYVNAMRAMGYPDKVITRIRINPKPEELKEDIIPVYLEQRVYKQVGKWKVTGKFDFVAEGRVQDFKSTSVWAYMNQVNADKQILQGSMYRWLNPELITDDNMNIHHIFLDWKQGMVKQQANYPTQRFQTQHLMLRGIAETENFVRQKLALIEKYWDAPEEEIPECDDESLWRNETVFKYYKSGDTSAARSTKNFSDKQEAYIHLSKEGKGAIKEVPGEVTACKFCASFPICTQKDKLIANGELILPTL